MTQAHHPIPPGYLEDAQGRLVPEKMVRPHELQRDALVRDLVGRIEAARAQMAILKRDLLADVAAHIQLIAEAYDVKISGTNGNVSLASYDGRLKIERDIAERIQIGEQIQAAEELIREILDEIADPTAKAIVDRAFRRNRKTGELSPARLVDLISVQVDDERWERAVAAIRDAIQTVGTVTYFRAYRRDEPDQPWQMIPLDFSAIAPAPPATEANWPDAQERHTPVDLAA